PATCNRSARRSRPRCGKWREPCRPIAKADISSRSEGRQEPSAAGCAWGGSLLLNTGITMTDQRIEGAATELKGKAQGGLGRLSGDSKLQVEGKLTEMKGKARDAYGRVIDGLDGMVDKAPADLRDPARKG